MKILLVIAIFGLTTSSYAETLAVPSFRIDVEDGWVHSIERGPQGNPEWGDLISIYHPNGTGRNIHIDLLGLYQAIFQGQKCRKGYGQLAFIKAYIWNLSHTDHIIYV